MAAAMKDMSAEMAKEYLPRDVESGWYPWWEHSGFFRPLGDKDPQSTAEKFVIVIPPPNVTGYLHLGHALTSAIQDSLIRWHRMKGHNTLYLPGTDHAGIATQVVVEKRLKAEKGLSRHDVGREKFVEMVWEYKNDRCGMIQKQLRLVGCSVDWTRERFTMDQQCARAVTEAFVRLHEAGLVYRATRLVNWCCALQSAISDLEVDFEEVEKNARLQIPGYDKKVEMGTLTHVAYKIVGTNDEIVVATTRPETILGDTAVAVHPDDERYKKYHGAKLQCPFRDAQIPLVLDPILVDMKFGTGAVKITPAHDPNDFECGERHHLEKICIMDLSGKITMEGEFKGMHRFDCRKAIVKSLEAKGLLRGVEPYTYRVGRCSRTGDIVEPMLMPQWYVDCTTMAKRSVEAVRSKQLRILPEGHEAVWYHFLENIKPWCVSRQLWWGHRIPAYKCSLDGTVLDEWIVSRSAEDAREKSAAAHNLSQEQKNRMEVVQDSDVLDTWFSSGLWPFSTMGWPDATPDMSAYFPGALLETMHDILFFWVARMVMMSLQLTDKLPFDEVYLHAKVTDKDGRKMSKSLGNVIDPLDVIFGIELEKLHDKVKGSNLDAKEAPRAIKWQKETFPKGIPECGSDALRFGLLAYTQSGQNINLDIDRIVGYRQFCNKLWNAVRFVLYHACSDFVCPSEPLLPQNKDTLSTESAWVLSRLETAVAECNSAFTKGQYDFAAATNAAYRFWLYELCDVFLEAIKPIMQRSAQDEQKRLTQHVLITAVEMGLRMLHPMMPFVTEELWHRLPNYSLLGSPSIMLARYPEPCGWKCDEVETIMKLLLDVVHDMRSTKASYNLTNKVRPDCWVVCSHDTVAVGIAAHLPLVRTLAGCGEIHVILKKEEATVPLGCVFSVVSSDVGVHMMLKGHIDVQREITKLENVIAGTQKQLDGLLAKMSAPDYRSKVPQEIQRQQDAKLESLKKEIAQATEGLVRMRRML